MTPKMKKSEALAALHAAVAEFNGATGPGIWQVDEDMGDGSYCLGRGQTVLFPQIGLTYVCGDPYHEGDEPWKQWGGEEIIRHAGLEDHPGDGVTTECEGTTYNTTIIAVLPDTGGEENE